MEEGQERVLPIEYSLVLEFETGAVPIGVNREG